MRFIDLFAGIGGFHYALKQIDKDAKLVMASEIDKYAKIAYSTNHKVDEEKILNIREYTQENEEGQNLLNSLNEVNLVMGGFPCQTFSNAGKKLGFLDETKGTLFFDVATIIKKKQPKYVLLENVKHLAKHDDGKTWETIRNTLRELGYLVPEEPILLSPHQFGIPQIRWRVFIPAVKAENGLKQKDIEFKFDKQFTDKFRKIKFDNPIDEKTIITDKKVLDALEAWGEFIKNVKRPFERTLPVVWLDYMNDKKVNFSGMQDWRVKYIKDMQELYRNNKEYIDSWMKKHNVNAWQKRERKLEWQAGASEFDYKNTYVQLRQSGFRFKTPDVFPTLVAMVQTSLFFDKTINKWRYLSTKEVCQLQSFPKTFKLDSVPEYQTYKQFGNSVNVDVVRMVLEKLIAL